MKSIFTYLFFVMLFSCYQNCLGQNNDIFDFQGPKHQISYKMKPGEGNGFEGEFNFEYCFVNCPAWNTPVLYFSRLPQFTPYAYHRNGKVYSTWSHAGDAEFMRFYSNLFAQILGGYDFFQLPGMSFEYFGTPTTISGGVKTDPNYQSGEAMANGPAVYLSLG